MPKILVSDELSPEAIALLNQAPHLNVDTGEAGLAHIEDYDALLVRSKTQVTSELLSRASNLKLIGRAGVGLDNIDLEAAAAKQIEVINTPHGNLISTAEHTIALLMALARHIPQACASMKSGKWEKSKFSGVEIRDKTLGIIGLGHVGSIVAELALGLKMKVVAYDPVIQSDLVVSLEALYQTADFITIHTPLNKHTKNLINQEAFNQMKPGVRLIHAARGGIVDENALLEALRKDHVAGAALDVFEQEPVQPDSELVKHPNVITTPHLAASTNEAQIRVGTQLAEKTIQFFSDN